MVRAQPTEENDDFGLNELTLNELRKELNERGIRNGRSLVKEQLKELLRQSIKEQILFGCEGFDNNNDD